MRQVRKPRSPVGVRRGDGRVIARYAHGPHGADLGARARRGHRLGANAETRSRGTVDSGRLLGDALLPGSRAWYCRICSASSARCLCSHVPVVLRDVRRVLEQVARRSRRSSRRCLRTSTTSTKTRHHHHDRGEDHPRRSAAPTQCCSPTSRTPATSIAIPRTPGHSVFSARGVGREAHLVALRERDSDRVAAGASSTAAGARRPARRCTGTSSTRTSEGKEQTRPAAIARRHPESGTASIASTRAAVRPGSGRRSSGPPRGWPTTSGRSVPARGRRIIAVDRRQPATGRSRDHRRPHRQGGIRTPLPIDPRMNERKAQEPPHVSERQRGQDRGSRRTASRTDREETQADDGSAGCDDARSRRRLYEN